jgi:RNA polymerase sigma-70 factor (ECF subfamily)
VRRNRRHVASNATVTSQKVPEVTPAVIDACRQGDREAFRVLYEAHKDRVYSMALYFFRGDAATAADVTQQVFLKLLDKVRRFEGGSNFSTWLHRFVVNVCVDRTRSPWRHVITEDPAMFDRTPGTTALDDEVAHTELARSIQDALGDLAPDVRMAIVLRYFEGLSYAEMAAILECPAGTVASRLSRGHEALARKLAALRPGRPGEAS